jgi:hypothetical protein
MPGNVTYWRENDHVQNLGDYLAELFLQRIAAAPPTLYPRIHLVGSCISNYFIRADLAACKANPEALIGFWGCGVRHETPLEPDLIARCRFHGVRGPLTRDELGLPAGTPLGDPALLLPYIYQPPPDAASGGTLRVPHIGDYAATGAVLARTGADRVLRPAVPRSIAALLELIDAICAAEFVLAGALHAAIIACAYGRPFAFYDGDGQIDLPFKWADFAASVAIPVYFVANVADGMAFWVETIAPVLRVPDLTPLLAAFPGDVRPEILALVARGDTILRAQAEPAASQLRATTC